MIKQEEVFHIGRLGKPHGIKGELSFMFKDDVFDRVDADYLVVEVDGILVPFFFEEYRFRTEETALVKFEGIDTQEQARELTNCEVFFPRKLLGEKEEELSLTEFVGYSLMDEVNHTLVGEIEALDDSTANLLFEVVAPKGKEILVPATPEIIRSIDKKNKTITVSLPEGLLDL